MEQTTQIQTQIIPKDMTLGDVVAKYPQSIEIMLSYGLHCVGCHVSYWETLEQGAMGHGMDQVQFEEMMGKLNKAAAEKPMGGEVTITAKASEKVKQIMAQNGKDGHGLRVEVIPGGCSGYSYGFDFAKDANEGDTIVEASGVRLIIDKESMKFLKGAKIDYVDTLQGAGFKVSNPNSTGGCGCGSSFSA